MKNKGFVITSIIYSLMLLFLLLVIGMITILSTRKNILENLTNDIIANINGMEKGIILTVEPIDVTIDIGSEYNVMTGVYAEDVDGTDITDKVVPSITSIDTSAPSTYEIIYKVVGNYNNVKIKTRTVTVSRILADTSGASVPKLHSNMIPVKWDGSNWVKADKSNPSSNRWFDYSIGQWANAVTVKDSARDYYINANPEEVITESDILTYMVWIPRYRYLLFNANNEAVNEHQIEVVFESKETTKSNGTANDTYLTHPAFTFGSEELDGFWVGKFEISSDPGSACYASSSTDNCNTNVLSIIPRVLPNAPSWRQINVSNIYAVLKNMNKTDNIYGYSSSVDTHMMKNSEWGAVAYLSQSKYGKNGNTNYTGANQEVYKNNSSSYITGRSGAAPGGFQEKSGVNEYEASGFFSYDGKCMSTTHSKCNSIGQQLIGDDLYLAYGASTTGTIYGVFDMSGGSNEYIMGAMYKSGNTQVEIASSGFVQATIDLEDMGKYLDKYTFDTSNTTHSRGHLGDATREILKVLELNYGWYDDSSIFSYNSGSNSPWFVRGGSYSWNANAGVYYYNAFNGGPSSNSSSRLSHP